MNRFHGPPNALNRTFAASAQAAAITPHTTQPSGEERAANGIANKAGYIMSAASDEATAK